jgi:hypothetical protein
MVAGRLRLWQLLLCAIIARVALAADVFVDPALGDDASATLGARRAAPLRTLRAAKDAVRALLRASDVTDEDVTVHLLPGVHSHGS